MKIGPFAANAPYISAFQPLQNVNPWSGGSYLVQYGNFQATFPPFNPSQDCVVFIFLYYKLLNHMEQHQITIKLLNGIGQFQNSTIKFNIQYINL